MFDLFYGWSRLMASGWSMTRTSYHVWEALGAAKEVVTSRSSMIRSSLHSPNAAHSAELARMVPEKIDAFSRAGTDTMTAWWSGQAAWTATMRDLALISTRGRWPTTGELARFSDGVTMLALETVETPARLSAVALAPIHRKVTGNAKRLRRKGKS